MLKILGSLLARHQEYMRAAPFQVLSELMSQRNFNKITLFDATNHVGVGRMAAYSRSVDKEDLLLAFMEHKAGRYTEELPRALVGTQDLIDRLRIYVRQQALIAWHFHFPISGSPLKAISHEIADRFKAHEVLIAQMLFLILIDAMDQGLTPVQGPERVIPLIHATTMGGRPTPSDPEQRRVYLESLDASMLRVVGARQPARAASTIVQPRATEPLEGVQAPGSLRHSAVN